jgi:hypothetical protein
MAVILKFRTKARAPAVPAMPGEGAQILFFTGVRYERAAVAATKATRRPRRPRPQRDTKSA